MFEDEEEEGDEGPVCAICDNEIEDFEPRTWTAEGPAHAFCAEDAERGEEF